MAPKSQATQETKARFEAMQLGRSRANLIGNESKCEVVVQRRAGWNIEHLCLFSYWKATVPFYYQTRSVAAAFGVKINHFEQFIKEFLFFYYAIVALLNFLVSHPQYIIMAILQ